MFFSFGLGLGIQLEAELLEAMEGRRKVDGGPIIRRKFVCKWRLAVCQLLPASGPSEPRLTWASLIRSGLHAPGAWKNLSSFRHL